MSRFRGSDFRLWRHGVLILPNALGDWRPRLRLKICLKFFGVAMSGLVLFELGLAAKKHWEYWARPFLFHQSHNSALDDWPPRILAFTFRDGHLLCSECIASTTLRSANTPSSGEYKMSAYFPRHSGAEAALNMHYSSISLFASMCPGYFKFGLRYSLLPSKDTGSGVHLVNPR